MTQQPDMNLKQNDKRLGPVNGVWGVINLLCLMCSFNFLRNGS